MICPGVIRLAGLLAFATVCLSGGCPPVEMDPNAGGGQDMTDETPDPSVELGFTEALSDTYTRVGPDEVMPFFTSGQGGSHIFATIRATGFPIDDAGMSSIALTEIVVLSDTGQELHNFTQTVAFEQVAGDMVEVASRFVFLSALPRDLEGRLASVTLTLVSTTDPTRIANLIQRVQLVRDGG
jgi:hypothetical protein